jgi:EF hand
MTRLVFAGAALAALVSTAAIAQQGGDRPAPQPIARADVAAQVEAQFALADADHDGAVTQAEADALRGASRAPRAEGERPRGGGGGFGRMGLRHFVEIDADHDGRLTPAEAQGAALAMFDRIDSNRDGTVTPDERRAAWQGMAEHRKHHAE